jgi:hypothetical protein
VRYDAPTNSYEIQLPGTAAWLDIAPVTGGTNQWATSGAGPVTIDVRPGGYSAILSWSGPESMGITAIGIPTPLSSIPRVGGASFFGLLNGLSSETTFDAASGHAPGAISGTISLTFNYGGGTLSGLINPSLTLDQTHSLGTLRFTETVYSVGSPTFSGKFETSVAGVNAFSGMFVGPTARNLIGSFAFPYLSPVGGQAEQAAGAFTAADRRVQP